MNSKFPSDYRICATCARWGGSRRPADPFRYFVEFEPEQRGTCFGGDFNLAQTAPMTTCPKWEQQYKKV